MRMKLFAVAALSAIPAVALAQTYIVYPSGTVAQAQVIDPSAPVYYTSSAPVVSSSGPVLTGSPAAAPLVGNPVVSSNAPMVYSNAPQAVYPSGQIAYSATPVVIMGTPVTQKSAESGPGTIDKTHPGTENGIGPSPRDAGTSSAGSGS